MVICNVGHAFSFSAETADQLILVLVAAAFPAAVRVAVIDRGELLHLFCGGKLAAVITGNGAKNLLEVPAKFMPEFAQHAQNFLCGLAFQCADNFIAGFAFRQNEQATAWTGAFAYYGIHFPEANICAGFNLLRAVINTAVIPVALGGVLLLLFFLLAIMPERKINAA